MARDYHDEDEEYDDRVPAVAQRRGVVAKKSSDEAPQQEPVIFERTIRIWASQWETTSNAGDIERYWTVGDIRTHLFGLQPIGNVDDPLHKIKEILESLGFVPVPHEAYTTPVYQLKRRHKDMMLTSDGRMVECNDGLSLFD